MLRILTGPFHPDLEDALADHIHQLKAADPLAPVALVVPSALLLARVRERLVVEKGLCLLNVHFLTFHQLARRLYEERRHLLPAEEAGPRLDLLSDSFFHHLVGQLLSRSDVGEEPVLPAPSGGRTAAAVWSSIRDLKDAAVDPSVALRAVEEDLFDHEDGPKLKALFLLYAKVSEANRVLAVGLQDDLAVHVVPWIQCSPFVSQLRSLCYYGFYDLTQVQLSLFEEVSTYAPVTLFFPMMDDSSFGFARRFLDRHLQSAAASVEPARRAPASDPTPSARAIEAPRAQVVSAVGPEDELAFVCKEILQLVETHGYRFGDIGVIARTLGPYLNALPRLLSEHHIPFTTTAVGPLSEEPAVKVMVQLASLPVRDFSRKLVLDVLSSPFYADASLREMGVERRPDLWRLITQSLAILRGEADWRKLEEAGPVHAYIDVAEEHDEGAGGAVAVEGRHVHGLWRLVSRLIRDCRLVPARGTYAEITESFRSLAEQHLEVPGLRAWEGSETQEQAERMIGIDQAMRACFDQLVQLDRLGTVVEYEDWFLLFTQLLEQSTVPMATPRHAGVSVLDAMSSRGLSFRALFVLGMNEKVFPRFIHEDAFLRDRHRRVLAATLGYKIDEKLSGYDEEQLLFALLQRAAGARLYLLHQRADAEGRPLAPSPYLAGNVAVGTGGEHAPELRFPRRLSERQTMRRWGPLLVTPQEFRLTSIFQGQDPTPVVGALWAVADLFRSGCAALDHIEAEAGRLGDYDGITGSLPSHWDAITAHGVSPTSLQQYAQCPFRYFGTHVLGLKPVRQAVAEEPSVQELGTLAHAVLASSYRRLVDTGWPEREVGIDSLQKTVASSGEEIFSAFAARRCTGYALLWRMAQDTIRDMVLAAVAADTEDYHHHGFKPIAFEVEGRGTIAGLGLPGPDSLPIRGRVDRLDQRIDPPGIRVVDYKYRLGKNLQSSERDLATSAVRGRRLQPPLYAKLRMTVPADSRGAGTTEPAQPERVELIYLVPRGERPVERATFEARDWERPLGQRLQRTLQILLEGVHAGRYFILPGDYCTRCEFSPACRRYHTPTWRRAHQASEGGRLRRLRTERVPRDE